VSFLALKNLFEQPLRLAFSVLGVALAVMMILVMWAILQGILAQAGAYVKHTDAQIWVVQKGFTDIAHGFSIVPAELEGELEAIPGVRSANPITGARTEVPTPADGEESVAVMGYDTGTGVGGPWEFATEPVTPEPGQVVADETFAGIAGIAVGDSLELPDGPREVVALSAGTNQFTNQLVFGVLDDVRGLLRLGPGSVNFFALQVERNRVSEVQAAIEERFADVTPFTQATFLENNEAEVREGFTPILYVLVAIAFFVGTAIVGLTLYTATTEKSQEYGVLSAIGADRRALSGVVLRQAAVTSALGLALGCLLVVPAGWLVGELAPRTALEFPAWLFAVTASATVMMAILASYVPVRRLARLDPAAVFRG
jgi:putative ABC transport system permease protein